MPPIVRTRIQSHGSFASRPSPIRQTSGGLQQSRELRKGLDVQQQVASAVAPTPIPDEDDIPEIQSAPEPRNIESDVGASIRSKQRKRLLFSAHTSIARHELSIAQINKERELFQSRIRLDHSTGRYVDSNWADPSIPSAGVGLTLEKIVSPSLLIPQAGKAELRVTDIDADGAAMFSKRIHIGDILRQVDGQDVGGQSVAEVLSKITGPTGSTVILALQSPYTGEIKSVSLIRGNCMKSLAVRKKLQANAWPDPKLYNHNSIFGMSLRNGLRQLCIFLVENRYWNRFVLGCVFLSVGILPFDDPFGASRKYFKHDYDPKSVIVDQLSLGLALIFGLDVFIKIIAMGLIFGKHAYLRDVFNRMDFAISVIGLVDVFAAATQRGTNAMRSVRALRPLKAINRFENLKTFVKLVFVVQEKLQDAVTVIVFLLCLFAVVSMQLFAGVMKQHCFHRDTGTILDNVRPCSRSSTQTCPYGFTCIRGRYNVQVGEVLNSDNFWNAVMMNFQILTLEDWSAIMYALMVGYSPAGSIFFLLNVLIIPTYCAQLFLAIVCVEIEPLQDRHLQAMLRWGVANWKEGNREALARPFRTWRYWSRTRPIVVKLHIEKKFKEIGFEKGQFLVKYTLNRLRHFNMIKAWDHWCKLMYDFHKTYYTGPQYYRAKMKAVLERKRKEATEAALQEAELLKLQVSKALSKYRLTILPNGQKYLPYFDLTMPAWFDSRIVIVILKTSRRIDRILTRFQRSWLRVAESKALENLVTLGVMANTAVMCCEHSRDSWPGQFWGEGARGDLLHVRFQSKLELAYIGFICFYALEGGIKIIGFGPRRYLSDPINVFDLMLAIISVGQLSLNVALWECTSTAPSIEDCDAGQTGLAALRVLRLVRVIRSFQRFTLIQKQIEVVFGVLKTSYSLFFLISMFVLVFSALGTELFYTALTAQEEDPHSLELGTQVWMRVEGLENPPDLPGRPGKVVGVAEVTFVPWTIELLSTFSQLGWTLGTVPACLDEEGCSNGILSVIPRENFASFSQSILTVIQIMTRSGWTQIFENTIAGTGYYVPCLYFYAIQFLWCYFLGNICAAVMVMGFSKNFDDRKQQLQAEALKEQRVKKIHREFKQALMREYVNRMAVVKSVDNVGNGNNSTRVQSPQPVQEVGNIHFEEKTRRKGIHWDPFQNDLPGTRRHNDGFRLLWELTSGRTDTLIKDSEAGVLREFLMKSANTTGKNTASVLDVEEQEVRQIQAQLAKMSAYERELYMRADMTSLEIGRHLAVTLGVAEALLQHRLEVLILQRDTSPDPQHAAYFQQQIPALTRRLREIKKHIKALRHGHQIGRAFFILRPYHPIRIFSCRIVHQRWFQRFMNLMVVGSCVTLWVERPSLSSKDETILNVFNTFFNFCFTVEFLLKSTGFNMVEYLRDGFNRIDFTIVVISLVDEAFKYTSVDSGNSVIQSLKVGRALRPLRVLARIESLRFMGVLIADSLGMILRAAFCSMVFIFAFALLGQQLYLGKMHTCSDSLVYDKKNCTGYVPNTNSPKQWIVFQNTFDWIGQSILSAYQVAITDSWYVSMEQGIDATGLTTGRWINNARANAFFFVLLVLIGRYVIQPYFVAVFLEGYLTASLKRSVIEEVREETRAIGKPPRSALPKIKGEDHASQMENYDYFWLLNILKPLPNQLLDSPPLWVSTTRQREVLPLLLFSRAVGWEKYHGIIQGGSLLLFKSMEEPARHIAILPGAKVRLVKTTDLDSEGLHTLGIAEQFLVIRLDQALYPRSTIAGHKYFWWKFTRYEYSAIWDSTLPLPRTSSDKKDEYAVTCRSMRRRRAKKHQFDDVTEDSAFSTPMTLFLCGENHAHAERILESIIRESEYMPPSAVKEAREQMLTYFHVKSEKVEKSFKCTFTLIDLRLFLGRVIADPRFEVLIASLIIASIFAKAFVTDKPPNWQSYTLSTAEFFLQYAFAGEALVRLLAYRPVQYFSDPWYVFDYLVVMSFYIGIIVEAFGRPLPVSSALVTRMQRIIRISRVLETANLGRLSRMAKVANFLCGVAIKSLGSFIVFLLILMFTFSAVGIVIFGNICTDMEQIQVSETSLLKTTRCALVDKTLDYYGSFANVELGMLALVKVFTGDNWIQLMNSCRVQLPKRNDGAMANATNLLRRWNASGSFMERSEIMHQVQQILPGCQSTAELESLRHERLVDCSAPSDKQFETPCKGNCGTTFALLYFPLFFFLSNSIIFNLVLSILFEALKYSRIVVKKMTRKKRQESNKPIIKSLLLRRLGTVYEAWISNAARKTRYEAVYRRSRQMTVIRMRNYSAVLCFRAWNAFTRENLESISQKISRKHRAMISPAFNAWRTGFLRHQSDDDGATHETGPGNDSSLLSVDGGGNDDGWRQSRSVQAVHANSDTTGSSQRDEQAPSHPRTSQHSDGFSRGSLEVKGEVIVPHYLYQSRSRPGSVAQLSGKITPDVVLEASLACRSPPHSSHSPHSTAPRAATLRQDDVDRDGRMGMRQDDEEDESSVGKVDDVDEEIPPKVTASADAQNRTANRMLQDEGPSSSATDKDDTAAAAMANWSKAKARAEGRQRPHRPQRTKPQALDGAAHAKPTRAGTKGPSEPPADRDGGPSVPQPARTMEVAQVMAAAGLSELEKLAVMRRAVARRPHNVPLLRHYGEVLARLGRRGEAEAAFQSALTHDPRDVQTLRAYLALVVGGGGGGADDAAAEVLRGLVAEAEGVRRLDGDDAVAAGAAQATAAPASRAEAEALLKEAGIAPRRRPVR